MFELRFANHLNPAHELLRAAQLIDWDSLHETLSKYYSPLGRSGKPVRLMVGLHILKHRYNGSDERAVEELPNVFVDLKPFKPVFSWSPPAWSNSATV